MTDTIQSESQQPGTSPYVELFDLDTTMFSGGGTYYFCRSSQENAVITWRGHQYTPFDVEAEGFDISGQGSLPRPKLRITNVTKTLMGGVIAWDDLLGATVTRWRTFRKFLGQSDQHFPEDIFKVQRKASANRHMIEWELSSFMDFEGQRLPRRQIIRDTCMWIYRRWSGTAWDYTNAQCPYVGHLYWNAKGISVGGASEDRCGKRLSDCIKRFGGGEVPTSAFPGVARVRVR